MPTANPARCSWTEGRRRATSPSILLTNGPAAARLTRLIWRAPYAALAGILGQGRGGCLCEDGRLLGAEPRARVCGPGGNLGLGGTNARPLLARTRLTAAPPGGNDNADLCAATDAVAGRIAQSKSSLAVFPRIVCSRGRSR